MFGINKLKRQVASLEQKNEKLRTLACERREIVEVLAAKLLGVANVYMQDEYLVWYTGKQHSSDPYVGTFDYCLWAEVIDTYRIMKRIKVSDLLQGSLEKAYEFEQVSTNYA